MGGFFLFYICTAIKNVNMFLKVDFFGGGGAYYLYIAYAPSSLNSTVVNQSMILIGSVTPFGIET